MNQLDRDAMRDAVAARHDRRHLVQRGEVGRPGVSVGHEHVPEAGPGERLAVVDHGVAHDALGTRTVPAAWRCG
jgi:hypothetical protein